MTPELRACHCGHLPRITERMVNNVHMVQIRCKCGNHGAALLSTKRGQEEKMRQAAVDGWNLGH